jgi:hypothetical protein
MNSHQNYIPPAYSTREIRSLSPIATNVEITTTDLSLFPSNSPKPIASVYTPNGSGYNMKKSPTVQQVHKMAIEKSVAEDLYAKAVQDKEKLRLTASNTLKLLKSKLIAAQEQLKFASKKIHEYEKDKQQRYKCAKELKTAYEEFKGRHITRDSKVELFVPMNDFPWTELEKLIVLEDKTSESLSLSRAVSSDLIADSMNSPSSNKENGDPLSIDRMRSFMISPSLATPSSYSEKQRHYFEQRIKILTEENKSLKQELRELKAAAKSSPGQSRAVNHSIAEHEINPRNIISSLENEVVQVDKPLFAAAVDLDDEEDGEVEGEDNAKARMEVKLRRVYQTLQDNLQQIHQTHSSGKEFKEVHLKLISRQLSQRLDKLQTQLSHAPSTTMNPPPAHPQQMESMAQQQTQQQQLPSSPTSSWPAGSPAASASASASSYESYELRKLQKLNKHLQEQVQMKDRENKELKKHMIENQSQIILQQHQTFMRAHDKKDIFDLLERSIKSNISNQTR